MVIAVFDHNQIMQSSQQWDPAVLEKLELDSDSTQTACATGKIGAFKAVDLGAEYHLPSISVDVAHVHLKKQFRIAASKSMIQWIDRFASGKGIGPLPVDTGEYAPQMVK